MPRRRLLTTLLNFDVAVLSFVVLNLILSIPMTPKQIALSLLGWESIGNSNWYIFVILLCYAVTYLVARFIQQKNRGKWLFIIILMVVLLLSFVKESYWYNTMLVFPTGFLYAVYQDRIERFLRKYYALLMMVLTIAFVIFFYFMPKTAGLAENIASICFAFFILMLSMKVVVSNPFLKWCGVHLFPLYIYQRLPMIAMSKCLGDDFVLNHVLVFVMIALVISCVIAYFYRYWQIRIRR